ncbi:MAG TPA: VCBS repeat-containing protein [Chthonomonadaceae bacterium]|nr:VCBS repeat-containing protein [Chthonomonadaceae bacterium]
MRARRGLSRREFMQEAALLAGGVAAAPLLESESGKQPAPAAPDSAASEDWPMPRHDRRLTNRSGLKGALQDAPRELWRLNTGFWTGDLEVVAAPEAGTVPRNMTVGAASEAQAKSAEGRRQVLWHSRMLDVAGSGTPVAVGAGYWGALLPGRKGLQRVAWTSVWGDSPSQLQCFSYENGLEHPRLEWETAPETTVYAPQTLLADVNGDGKREVVCAMHYRILIYEGATGRKLHELRYHRLRNYGFFGLFFEPGDPYAKFVNISDFANHFDVVNFDGGGLLVAFRRDIEGTQDGGIERHTKIVRPGPNPLEDIDGDGHAEMTFNLFNDEGDGKWHVMSYQPLTGTVKLNLAGHYLVGIYDVDGCGFPELLCQTVSARHMTGWHGLRIVKLRNGSIQDLFATKRARFGTFDLAYLPPTADTGAAGGRTTAAAGRIGPQGEPGFVVLRPDADLQPARAEAAIWRDGGFAPGWEVAAPSGGAIAIQGVQGREYGESVPPHTPAPVLLNISSPASTAVVTVQGASVRTLSWQARAVLAPLPVVVTAGKRKILVTEMSSNRVAAYALSSQSEPPRLLWERPGRGMATGSGRPGGIAAGDVDGDGRPEVVFAAQDGRTGAAALLAVDMNGHTRWKRVFSGFDSDRPQWNMGGLTLWTLAHLTEAGRLDVYVNTRRSTMHSDESVVLHGRTGAVVWAGDAVPVNDVPKWGFGGTLVACADLQGSGLEQIISEYPVVYYVVDGRSGRFLRTVDLAAQTVLPGWAAYGVPVVADFLGSGQWQVLVPSPYVYGLLTPEGKALWSAPTKRDGLPDAGVSGCEVGDFDGDGRLEVARLFISASAPERTLLELLDGATGKPKGNPFLHAQARLQGAVVADLNGDGADELLLRTEPNTVGALSMNRGEPRLVWQFRLPAEPVRAIVADVNSDRIGELVVGCADGALIALGK